MEEIAIETLTLEELQKQYYNLQHIAKKSDGERYDMCSSRDKKIKALEEENRNLKSELEKYNETYKKYRDYEKQELADSLYDLHKENDKLKSDLDYRQHIAMVAEKRLENQIWDEYDEDVVKDENTYRDLDL